MTGDHHDDGDVDALIAEAAEAPLDGWDFSWLDGRASEQRPTWRYAQAMGRRMARARTALDIATGGGEVLAGVEALAPYTVATESWPPNLPRAAARLAPRGVTVVAADDAALPFAANTFDLVVSRHPVTTSWPQIARVLTPAGVYFSQQVGPASVFELVEYFLGPQPADVRTRRDPERARAGARAAGLDVVDLRAQSLHTEFRDVGAVVYFLRLVVWMVPDFTVERYRHRLHDLHRHIRAHGPFTARTTRFLIEARKPLRPQI
jgi:SAM-dependent methyltransferase